MNHVVEFMAQMCPVSDCSAHECHSGLTEIIEGVLLILCSVVHDVIRAGAKDVRYVVSDFVE